MSRPCRVCAHGAAFRCEPRHLYVVQDAATKLVKIGMTKKVSRRLAQHRIRYPHVVLCFKAEAGCEFVALIKEEAALKIYELYAQRFSGDWFVGTVERAVFSVKTCLEIEA